MPVSVQHSDLEKEIAVADSLIKKVELFDVYEGSNIGADYKSMAYRITYGADDRTLKADEVENIQEKVIKLLEKKLQAEVRK